MMVQSSERPCCFVSDLHLTNDDSKEQLEVVDSFRRVVLRQPEGAAIFALGDIPDLWRDSFNDVAKARGPFFDVLSLVMQARHEVIYLVGNHDDLFWDINLRTNVVSILQRLDWFFHGQRGHIAHGHQWDRLVYDHYVAARAGAKLAEWIWRLFKVDMGKSFKFENWSLSDAAGKDQTVLQAMRQKVNETFKDRYKIVVHGHSHQPAIVKHDSGLLEVDCGSLLDKGSWVEYSDGVFRLLRWSGDAAEVIDSADLR